MDELREIRAVMERFGRQVRLCLPDGWQTEHFGAFLQPLRYKNKMYLGGVNTRIGFNREGYYLYLGPPEHDLTQLGRDMWIQAATNPAERYTVDRAEAVYFGEHPSHIWAIVRSMVE
ncbi:MAG: hypothetical protein LBG83_07005 [Oscillospiraceae bacterium]|jgi:hypothetical protein|nr:hypothetical protein [Oscillospiraceae bacterium]